MVFIDELLKALKKDRPKLSDGSLLTYKNQIEKLYKKVSGHTNTSNFTDLKWVNDIDNIMEVISDMKPSSQKIILTSVAVFLSLDKDKENDKNIKKYRDKMLDIQNEMREDSKGQHKTDKEEKNWTTMKSLDEVRKGYRREINNKGILKKNAELSPNDFNLLQRYLVSSLYTIQPPQRNDYIMDVVSSKEYDDLSDDDKAKSNFLEVISRGKKVFHFNHYKTVARHGAKEIEVNKQLNAILNIWLKFNKSGWLLLNKQKQPLTPNGLTKLVSRTFSPTGKNITVNMIRKIFLTEKFGHEKDEKEKLAHEMGHTVATQQTKYVKHDKEE